MELINIKKIAKSANLIILADKKSSLKEFNFSEKELKFVKNSIKNEHKIIELNQFERYIFIVILSKEKMYANQEKVRKSAYKMYGKISSKEIKNVTIVNTSFSNSLLLSFVEGLMLSNYSFTKYFTKDVDKKQASLNKIKVKSKNLTNKDLQRLLIIVEGVFITRDLVNEPFSGLNAVQFAERINNLSKEAGFSVEILNKKQIETLKMGGLLTVNRASKIPPTFSIIKWKHKDAKNSKPLILVGKGIVFDTGGYNLKPGKFMNDMKSDMGGGAAVVGTMYAISKLNLPINVIGLVPATDNLIGKDGYVTGDVIKMHNGMTVEVLNTDAEGRLILADALSYAQKYNPELVIDMATLTGAAVHAIDNYATAIMSNASRKTTNKLLKSGEATNERLIEFPLWDEYGEGLKSKLADLKNLGNSYAGHISAAKFLEHFTDYPWIHLDIAPSAFLDAKTDYRGVGATGTPVRLLVNFIENSI